MKTLTTNLCFSLYCELTFFEVSKPKRFLQLCRVLLLKSIQNILIGCFNNYRKPVFLVLYLGEHKTIQRELRIYR